jgi:hypothetical protein
MHTENLKERDDLGYLGVAGRNILKWILNKEFMNVWSPFTLFQDRDKWRALVNMKTNLRDSHEAGDFLTS